MKMVKSLLLGSAAGLVALTGAQAADLPVKAKAVEYVKICSAYGAGFYYIPGTDICLRVGGYVRADYYAHERTGYPLITNNNLGSNFVYNRDDNGTSYRARMVVIMDARTNTAYGTLRSYFAGGITYDTNATGTAMAAADYTPYLERAFIQFAGFTFGYTVSFFDPVGSFGYSYVVGVPARWTSLIAYTANFGGGWTGTLSLENATSRRGELDFDGANLPASATFDLGPAGHLIPDIVANVRADQAWGSFQFSGALHELRPNQANAARDDGWGWALAAGVEIKTPSTGPKDSVTLSGAYTKGAYDFTGVGGQTGTQNATTGIGQRNNSLVGPVIDTFDGYYDAGGSLKLPTAWSAAVQFRHYWTPMFRSSIGVGYFRFEPPGAAQLPGNIGFPDGTVWQVESTHIWSPVKDLDLGVEVFYTNIKTNCAGASAATCATTDFLDQSKGILAGMFRAQRNF